MSCCLTLICQIVQPKKVSVPVYKVNLFHISFFHIFIINFFHLTNYFQFIFLSLHSFSSSIFFFLDLDKRVVWRRTRNKPAQLCFAPDEVTTSLSLVVDASFSHPGHSLLLFSSLTLLNFRPKKIYIMITSIIVFFISIIYPFP